jgi:hypothetical protein
MSDRRQTVSRVLLNVIEPPASSIGLMATGIGIRNLARRRAFGAPIEAIGA